MGRWDGRSVEERERELDELSFTKNTAATLLEINRIVCG